MALLQTGSGLLDSPRNMQRLLYPVGLVLMFAAGSLLVLSRLHSQDFLPHSFCYLQDSRLIWTHVLADASIALAYLAISLTLGFLIWKARTDIPLHWMFLAFGLFIVACGGTHLMEVVTIWKPMYVMSALVKVFTAWVSLTTAVVLPGTISNVLALVRQAKASDRNVRELLASEERKEALLREVHHRVKNNLAIICSLFYLQSTREHDEQTVQVFREMESRVHSMALVHETLYGSENLARLDFAEYARILSKNIIALHRTSVAIQLKTDLQSTIMGADLAIPCGLILNELMSNAFKHAFPDGAEGEIRLRLNSDAQGHCNLLVEDSGVGVPDDFDVRQAKSLGMKVVLALTKQMGGGFELTNTNFGTSARLTFSLDRQGG